MRVEVMAADPGKMDHLRRIAAEADAAFGRIDTPVNAAGLTDRGNLLNTTPELFPRIMAVIARAPNFLMQDVVKIMGRDGEDGTVVDIGSPSERAGQPFIAACCASKACLATFTRNSGQALMRNRTRVNQPDIGCMNADSERRRQEDEIGDPAFIDKAWETRPFGRLLEPEEPAQSCMSIRRSGAAMTARRRLRPKGWRREGCRRSGDRALSCPGPPLKSVRNARPTRRSWAAMA